jgi:hypothetical protein
MLGLEEAKGDQAIFEPSKVVWNWMSKYHLVMTNIAMERSTMFKFGKPSISMGHLYHGYFDITGGYFSPILGIPQKPKKLKKNKKLKKLKKFKKLKKNKRVFPRSPRFPPRESRALGPFGLFFVEAQLRGAGQDHLNGHRGLAKGADVHKGAQKHHEPW